MDTTGLVPSDYVSLLQTVNVQEVPDGVDFFFCESVELYLSVRDLSVGKPVDESIRTTIRNTVRIVGLVLFTHLCVIGVLVQT